MQIARKTIRDIAASLASIVLGIVVLDPLGQFTVAYLQERGFYDHPSRTVDVAIDFLAAIATSHWFHWLGGSSLGFAAGVWLDSIVRSRAAKIHIPIPKPSLEKGFLDYQVELMSAYREMGVVLTKIAKRTEWIGNRIRKQTSRIEKLKAKGNPLSPRFSQDALSISADAAKEFNDFCESIEGLAENFIATSASIIQANQWLFDNAPGWRSAQYVNDIRGLKNATSASKGQLQGFAEACIGNKGTSSVLNAAVDRTATLLQNIVAAITRLDAFCDYVINAPAGSAGMSASPSSPSTGE